MYKVTHIVNGLVKGVWFQQADSASEAVETVRDYYAGSSKGDFLVEAV